MANFDRGFKAWAERVSISTRKELNLKPHQALSSTVLARHLNIILKTPNDIPGMKKEDLEQLLNTGKDEWSATTINSKNNYIVIFNPSHPSGRKNNTIMHEISHIICGHEQSKMILSYDSSFAMQTFNQKQEDEADWLSSCFLLPREALIYIKKNNLSTDQVCKDYTVSEQLLNYRLNISGVNFQLSNSYQKKTTLK